MQTNVRFPSFLVPILIAALAIAAGASTTACGGEDGRPGSGTGGGRGDGSGAGDGSGSGTNEDQTDTAATSPAEGAGSPADATKKANAEGPCASDAECTSGVCFAGNTQSYCTARCTIDDAATTCAAPFTGTCNKQGFCKRD